MKSMPPSLQKFLYSVMFLVVIPLGLGLWAGATEKHIGYPSLKSEELGGLLILGIIITMMLADVLYDAATIIMEKQAAGQAVAFNIVEPAGSVLADSSGAIARTVWGPNRRRDSPHARHRTLPYTPQDTR